MKARSIFFIVLCFVLFKASSDNAEAGTPHIVYGKIMNSDGTVPAAGTVKFKAYLSGRPGEILTESNTGCGYQNGLWWVEVGNFPTNWSVGEVLIADIGNGNTGSITLNGNGKQELALSVSVIPPESASDTEKGGDGDSSCFVITSCYDIKEKKSAADGSAWGLILMILLFTAGMIERNLYRGICFIKGNFIDYLIKPIVIISFFQLGFIMMLPDSAFAGSFTFELKAGLNGISVPFTDTGITTAEKLVNAISGCNTAGYWDASQQRFVEHQKGSAANNFTVFPGYPYFVRVTANTKWTVSGELSADTEFEAVTTQTTNINAFAVPLDRTDLKTAEDIVNDIPNCDVVWYWDTEKNGYAGHPKGTLINNFPVKQGNSYFVNIGGIDNDGDGYTEVQGDCDDNNAAINPGATEICGDEIDQNCDGRDNMFTIQPNNLLKFKVDTKERTPPLTEIVPPLAYTVKEVWKDGSKISLPDNAIFDENTGEFSWTPTQNQSGEYEFIFSVENSQNKIEKKAYIMVTGISRKDISGVSADRVFINPAAGEVCSIKYILDKPANVTIDIYRVYLTIGNQGDGKFQKESEPLTIINNESRPAGENSEIWNGKGADGKSLEPSVYVYAIKAVSTDKTYIYDPEYVSGLVDISKFTVSPLKFNPYANQSLELKYSLLQPAWVTIGGNGMRGFAIAGKPRDKGENIEKWDGSVELWKNNKKTDKTDKTKFVSGILNLAAKAEILPENAIVIKEQDSSLITNVSTEAYVIVPSYGEISTVKYTLSENAVVFISISDPNGNNLTLSKGYEKGETQSKGEHSVEWHGVNADGKLVWPLTTPTDDNCAEDCCADKDGMVCAEDGVTTQCADGSALSEECAAAGCTVCEATPEGDYTVEIKAVEIKEGKESGVTATKRANIHVYR